MKEEVLKSNQELVLRAVLRGRERAREREAYMNVKCLKPTVGNYYQENNSFHR